MGRPLYVLPIRQGLSPAAIFSTDVSSPRFIANWSLHKGFIPAHTGLLGVRFCAKIVHPNLGVHVFFVLGGGPTDTAGVASPHGVMTAGGANTSPRLDVDLTGLYAGRDIEYLKLFTFYDPGGGGGLPNIDTQTVMLSGDAPVAAPVLDDEAIMLCDLDQEYEVESADEELLYEWSCDFGLVESPVARVALMGLTQVDAGTARWRVRVGGTPGNLDAPVIAEIATTATSWENRIASATFINPATQVLVKLSGLIEGGVEGVFRGAAITIKETA